ncbi:MAG: hypothetical protein AB8B63_06465 [Granulosicoccus sp.]
MRSRITTAILSSLLIIAGCSENDSSDDMNPSGDQSNETSQPAPGDENGDVPLSSEPGGDTSAIAGLWDASFVVEGGRDQRRVDISPDGLYTLYDYRQDALASDGNCYFKIGPLTLTPEDPASNTYSLPDDRTFTAVAEPFLLFIQFADAEQEQWAAVTGDSADNLNLCT